MMDKKDIYAFKNEKSILQGNRSCSGNILWDIPITDKNKIALLRSLTEAAGKKYLSPQSMGFNSV